MNNEDTLISKLLEETCKEENPENDSSNNLYDYFERKVNQVEFLSLDKYLVQQNIENQSLVYNQNNKCFRLEFGCSVIDFPSNWGAFSKLKTEQLVFIYAESDDDFLCDIFSELVKNCSGIVMATEGSSSKLILIDSNVDEHFKWIQNYYDKKSIIKEKAA